MLDNKLIHSALALNGKTIQHMEEIKIIKSEETGLGYDDIQYWFSIEKMCYYLLSETFIEKYDKIYWGDVYGTDCILPHTTGFIGDAIYEYQSGNEVPLTTLLTKIPGLE